MKRKKKVNMKDIFEKLKWYHGEQFNESMLNDDFLEQLKKEY